MRPYVSNSRYGKGKKFRANNRRATREKRQSERSIAPVMVPGFGDAIRAKRRELDLTQDELAARIKISTPYIGHLESGKRHPSDKIVTKLAEALGLDNRELFLLANPHAEALISEPGGERARVGSSLRRTKNFNASTTSRMTKCRFYPRWR